MCGIAGSINCPMTESDLNLLKHRGPDYQELIKFSMGDDMVFLGHTRLSILDLSPNGNQPMTTDCGQFTIVFNGEIYNHLDLRRKITNVNFKGTSDTETILYYLREFGIDAINDFNGIFAFALVDRSTETVYLARDHFGVKPIYYYAKGNQLIFGSELKIIKNNACYKKEIDLSALDNLLTFRYNPAPETLFKDVKKLGGASYLVYRHGELKEVIYWQKKQSIISKIGDDEAIAEYQRLLKQAVKRQLLSDVPVGLLLSGGLDSALLGYLMAEESSYPIQSFTVGFEGKGNFNEINDAKETAELIRSEHRDIFMEKDQYLDFFYKSFYHTEEPISEPTIPALCYVSQLASQHVKVVLSGQGADELMAGYNRYRGEKILSQYSRLLSLLPLKLISKFMPASNAIDRGIYSSKFSDELERFVAIFSVFTPDVKKRLYNTELSSLISKDKTYLFEKSYALTDSKTDSLSRLLFLDTRGLLPDNLLLFNDKMTMANSIENRVPYLDIDLVNFIESLPIDLKLRGKTGKYIHRKAAEKWIPKSIIERKKRGFETPVGEWFKNELSTTLIDLIDSPASLSKLYLNTKEIKQMLELHRMKKKDYSRHLFILFSLEMWYKNFYLPAQL